MLREEEGSREAKRHRLRERMADYLLGMAVELAAVAILCLAALLVMGLVSLMGS